MLRLKCYVLEQLPTISLVGLAIGDLAREAGLVPAAALVREIP